MIVLETHSQGTPRSERFLTVLLLLHYLSTLILHPESHGSPSRFIFAFVFEGS